MAAKIVWRYRRKRPTSGAKNRKQEHRLGNIESQAAGSPHMQMMEQKEARPMVQFAEEEEAQTKVQLAEEEEAQTKVQLAEEEEA